MQDYIDTSNVMPTQTPREVEAYLKILERNLLSNDFSMSKTINKDTIKLLPLIKQFSANSPASATSKGFFK